MAAPLLKTEIEISKEVWLNALQYIDCPPMAQMLSQLNWNTETREILKAMRKTYRKENDHDKFQDFLEIAGEFWRKLKDHINI